MDKYSDCIVIEAHRWQSSEVNDNNFGDYLRRKVDYAYSMGPEDRLNYYQSMNHSTFIPNLSYWDEEMKKSNLQRTIEIKPNESNEGKLENLKNLHNLHNSVKNHNMWAVSEIGMHRYHLKNLQFVEYKGTGIHPDPVIDSMISHCRSINESISSDFMQISGNEFPVTKLSIVDVGDFSIFPVDEFSIAGDIPGLWDWENLSQKQKKSCLNMAKKRYYKSLYLEKSIPICVTPLTNLGFGKVPMILSDSNDILEYLTNHDYVSHGDFMPLKVDELNQLQFYISAGKWMPSFSPHHAVYDSLIHDYRHSTDIYDNKQIISIPYSIHQLLIEKFGREPNESELKDILEKGLID